MKEKEEKNRQLEKVGTLATAGSLKDDDVSNEPPAPALHISAGVQISLLNTDLAALFELDGNSKKILIMPTDEPKGGMTFTEFVNAVKSMIGTGATFDTNGIEKTLSSFGLEMKNISIELRQVFLYWDSTIDKSLEYALCIDVTANPTQTPLGDLFSVKKLSFSIWNTVRQSILDRMRLGSISKLLAQ